MSSNEIKIYPLKNLSPELIAVTFAKCSRSEKSFDEIAKELTEEKSAEFHDKWVVGYGHSSVAEHAFLNIAIENVSLVAVEAIQANRLASYTEKSSRYQIYNKDRIFIPEEFNQDQRIREIYLKATEKLFEVYNNSMEPVQKIIYQLYPNAENEPDLIWKAKIKSKWVDVCRFLLPNCVLANLGMSANARTWEYAITKWLSSPLAEVRQIGEECKKVAMTITPTLVKYAEFNNYYKETNDYIDNLSSKLNLNLDKPKFNNESQLEVELIDYDKDAEDKILAALLYRNNSISYAKALEQTKKISNEAKEKIFDEMLSKAKTYEKPPRELEYIYYTFDVLLDQGAYYDLKRNRIMTQTPQSLNFDHGYFIPEIIKEANLEKEYNEAQNSASQAYIEISAKFPSLAQYITTKASARRFLLKMNLREAFYFIGLRSKKSGHFMYRKVAQMMYDKIEEVHPMLAKYIKVDKM
ncbi:MAG: FAD-dependent thymidylate synthase [bacterium]